MIKKNRVGLGTRLYTHGHPWAHIIHKHDNIIISTTPNAGRHGQFGVVYKACLLREGPPSQEITVALKTPKGA